MSNITFECGEMYAECRGLGLLLPILEECLWNRWFRATLYLLGLFYCFLGVAIIADIFMCSIEKITSKTRKIYLASEKDEAPTVYEVRMWSDTVANLTLMALGSSAPEILLSIIEIMSNDFNAGPLGPGTIVGSAAFNLFVIIAICVMSIPNGETRRIKDIKVFSVTAFFSVLAYLWLLLILLVTSPNEVDIWEAAVTLFLFVVLVLIAWLVEKNICGLPSKTDVTKQIELGQMQPGENENLMNGKNYFKDGHIDRDGLVAFVKEVKKYPGLTDEDAAVLAATKLVQSQDHSRMWYRVGAVRNMTGGRKTVPQISMKLKQVYTAMNEHPEAKTLGDVPEVMSSSHAVMQFHSSSCTVREDVGKFPVVISRNGKIDTLAKIRVESIDGTANVDADYVRVNEMVTFEPFETEKEVMVEIINDNQWEPDETFFLKLSLIRDGQSELGVQLGRISIIEVTILDNDEPGKLAFQKRGYIVKESCGEALVTVERKDGSDGEVSVKWRTYDKSAVDKRDYVGGEGVVIFKHTETTRDISIPIVDDMVAEKNENFEIELFEPEGGAKLGSTNRTAVTIMNDDNFTGIFDRMMLMTNVNLDQLEISHGTWLGQIKDALSVNGGDLNTATGMDYFMHFMTFGWKIIFSLVPPPSMLGGWLCFVVALGFIAILTAIIGDLATLFGCLVGLDGSITAITIVALGTSLPDTFASRAAAVGQKTADSSIGNVTGSNSVNVFLGLGLPWLIASIYHHVNGTKFIVDAEGLPFNVALFTGLSCVCIAIIVIRRYLPLSITGKAELGGPTVFKYITGALMISLWLIYITVSILKINKII